MVVRFVAATAANAHIPIPGSCAATVIIVAASVAASFHLCCFDH
jgi:hypothetical protein